MTERELLLTAVRKCERIDLYVDPRPLTPQEHSAYEGMCRRYQSGEPLQYILGECDFLGHKIAVSPKVLIPRPETEILVDTIIAKLQNNISRPCRILDLGTGSGNIAIALAKTFDSCHVTAIDISLDAIAVAKQNAAANGVASRIDFVCADMLSWKTDEYFDCIVSNPPYIKTSELDSLPPDVRQEPRLALDGGVDGLNFYRAILAHAHHYLKPGGFLFLEIGDGQAPLIQTLAKEYPFYKNLCFYPDYTKTERIVSLQKDT